MPRHARFLKNPASLETAEIPNCRTLFEHEKETIRTYQPRYSWEPHPFAPYQLSNNNANIRRIKERIAQLEKAGSRETVEVEPVDGLRIVQNAEANRVQIFFPGKPAEAVRSQLKRFGFRWAPSEGAWQRHLNASGIWAADNFAAWFKAQQSGDTSHVHNFGLGPDDRLACACGETRSL